VMQGVRSEVMACQIYEAFFFDLVKIALTTLAVNVLGCFCYCILQNVTTVRLKPVCGK
jgi:fluoride ion exporter CrcB/FEX